LQLLIVKHGSLLFLQVLECQVVVPEGIHNVGEIELVCNCLSPTSVHLVLGRRRVAWLVKCSIYCTFEETRSSANLG
jgi:hypothetical protein